MTEKRHNMDKRTINVIKARLEQNPNVEERRRLLIGRQYLLKSAKRVMNRLPKFNPLKTRASRYPNMSAEDIQELKAKFQELAATSEDLENDFAQLERNIRAFQNDVISEAEKAMKKGPNAGV